MGHLGDHHRAQRQASGRLRLSWRRFAPAAIFVLTACGERAAEEAVAARFPASATPSFQAVQRHGDAVCGEVNARGEGGTRGYTRFVWEERAGATIAPRTSYERADLQGFEATCRMLGGRGNGLDRQVCTRAADARREIALEQAFGALWRKTCGA